MNIMHYRSWLFLEGFYFPTGLCLPPFAVSAVHADCNSKFCKSKSSVFCLYNRQLNCKNSAQNALEVDILRSKVKKLFDPDSSLSWKEDPLPTPYPSWRLWRLDPRASRLAPLSSLFANPGSATAREL